MKPRILLLPLFASLLVASASAQPVHLSGAPGYAIDSPYNQLYPHGTMVNVSGRVTGVQVAAPMRGMANSVTLLLRDARKRTIVVDLGPAWFVKAQETKVRTGDAVRVIGSQVAMNGHPVVLARQVIKGKRVLALRRGSGEPYWVARWDGSANGGAVQFPSTSVPVQGQVVGMTTYIEPGTGMIDNVVTIATDQGQVNVDLGPQGYYENQGVSFQVGQGLTIQSSGAVRRLGNITLLPAYGIVAGNQTLVLSYSNGRPVWTGAGGS